MRYKFLLFVVVGLLLFAAGAFALGNPLAWVKNSLGDLANVGLYGLGSLVLGWLVKGKINEVQLRQAVSSIKNAVDSVRMSNDANSPGGAKVTVGEAVGIAEKSLTSILASLRMLNPKWIPHWLDGTTPTPNP